MTLLSVVTSCLLVSVHVQSTPHPLALLSRTQVYETTEDRVCFVTAVASNVTDKLPATHTATVMTGKDTTMPLQKEHFPMIVS